jgi:hypothetical protein
MLSWWRGAGLHLSGAGAPQELLVYLCGQLGSWTCPIPGKKLGQPIDRVPLRHSVDHVSEIGFGKVGIRPSALEGQFWGQLMWSLIAKWQKSAVYGWLFDGCRATNQS